MEEQIMKNSKYLLPVRGLFVVFFFGYTTCVQGTDNCTGTPNFPIYKIFAIQASGCNATQCILNAAQIAQRDKLVEDFKKLCTRDAALNCASKACPQPAVCQALIQSPPALWSSVCTVDTNGICWCQFFVQGVYSCNCVTNKVTVIPSNTTGNFCPGDNLLLYAETMFPILNISYIQWFRDGSILPGANAPSYVVNSPGIYEAMIVDTDGNIYLSAPFTVQCLNPIPTLTQWGIIILAAMLILSGTLVLLNKRSVILLNKK
jgi:hypothetical protein